MIHMHNSICAADNRPACVACWIVRHFRVIPKSHLAPNFNPNPPQTVCTVPKYRPPEGDVYLRISLPLNLGRKYYKHGARVPG